MIVQGGKVALRTILGLHDPCGRNHARQLRAASSLRSPAPDRQQSELERQEPMGQPSATDNAQVMTEPKGNPPNCRHFIRCNARISTMRAPVPEEAWPPVERGPYLLGFLRIGRGRTEP
jgi:hypothetical protein